MVSHQLSTADLSTIKGRQQKSWSTGDYSVIGATVVIISEELCEATEKSWLLNAKAIQL